MNDDVPQLSAEPSCRSIASNTTPFSGVRHSKHFTRRGREGTDRYSDSAEDEEKRGREKTLRRQLILQHRQSTTK